MSSPVARLSRECAPHICIPPLLLSTGLYDLIIHSTAALSIPANGVVEPTLSACSISIIDSFITPGETADSLMASIQPFFPHTAGSTHHVDDVYCGLELAKKAAPICACTCQY